MIDSFDIVITQRVSLSHQALLSKITSRYTWLTYLLTERLQRKQTREGIYNQRAQREKCEVIDFC